MGSANKDHKGFKPAIEFADENSRIAWETTKEVEAVAVDLPPEGQQLDFQTITFPPKYKHKGFHAIFSAGTVIGTPQRGVFIVPARTIKILDALGIKYRIIP